MARRHTGLSSLQRHLDNNESYSSLSTTVQQQQQATLKSQLHTFQSALSNFSSTHRAKIASSPEFRQAFSQMCSELGVDPLGGGQKGMWDKLGVGDWYYALGVQIVDVCLKARERGGGLVALEEVITGVELLRNPTKSPDAIARGKVTKSDIKRAIETLEPLGCGYAVLELGPGSTVVRCLPGGLDRDSLVVVEAASALVPRDKAKAGAVGGEEVYAFTRRDGVAQGWTMDRVDQAVDKAVKVDGLAWVDDQAPGPGALYWVPALFDFGGE